MHATIAAISSPPGGAERAIVRLSGPDARRIADACFAGEDGAGLAADAPRGVRCGRIDDGVGTQPAALFWMPAPRSYTREDVVELHVPGNPFLAARVLARVVELGATPAAPGEFTRRAFLNGRIDLTRAEGVLELVSATTEGERRAAMRLFAGGLDERVRALRDRLDEVRALAEASLDFDESDTGHVPTAELAAELGAIGEALAAARRWEVARQPPSTLPRVLFFGAPNAGKSSLFNALAGEVGDARAIVSDLAGTTRDAVAAVVVVGEDIADGERFQVLALDTPGLDDAALGPDRTAQRLAASELASADLVLWVVDATRDEDAIRREAPRVPAGPLVVAWNKVDLAAAAPVPGVDAARVLGVNEPRVVVGVSAVREDARSTLAGAIARALGRGGAETSVGRELFARHHAALVAAHAAVLEARAELDAGQPLDFVAETLRGAGRELDAIDGRTSPEDLLDRIFARFCLGK